MNILVVHKKYSGNEQSYYFFVRDMIERYGMQHNAAVHSYTLDLKLTSIENDHIIFLRLPDKSAISLLYWHKITLQGIIKKLNIHKLIFINTLPLSKSTLPQTCVFTDVSFAVINTQKNTHNKFLSKNFSRKLAYVQHAIAYSAYAESVLKNRVATEREKIVHLLPAATYGFMERSFNEKEIRKEILTGGEAFFLAKVSDDEDELFINVLKAFTGFKKWQKSHMKLVITGFEKGLQSNLKRKLSSYKYAEDIVLLGEEHKDIYPEILSAAYAFLLIATKDSEVIPALEAMQSYTLCMASTSASLQEIAGDAYLPLNVYDVAGMSNAMIKVYKEESFAEDLIQIAAARAQHFAYDAAMQTFFNYLTN